MSRARMRRVGLAATSALLALGLGQTASALEATAPEPVSVSLRTEAPTTTLLPANAASDVNQVRHELVLTNPANTGARVTIGAVCLGDDSGPCTGPVLEMFTDLHVNICSAQRCETSALAALAFTGIAVSPGTATRLPATVWLSHDDRPQIQGRSVNYRFVVTAAESAPDPQGPTPTPTPTTSPPTTRPPAPSPTPSPSPTTTRPPATSPPTSPTTSPTPSPRPTVRGSDMAGPPSTSAPSTAPSPADTTIISPGPRPSRPAAGSAAPSPADQATPPDLGADNPSTPGDAATTIPGVRDRGDGELGTGGQAFGFDFDGTGKRWVIDLLRILAAILWVVTAILVVGGQRNRHTPPTLD